MAFVSVLLLTNVHGRRQGELHHQNVAVQGVVRQEPDSIRAMNHGDPDQWEHHESYADNCDDHGVVELRFPEP
jgi:hypothetical protein